MAELFFNGYLVDAILILVVIEAVILSSAWALTRRGVAPADLLPTLCAGAFLVLALRVTLAGAGWMAACGCLAIAGLAHLFELRRRWKK